MSDLSPREHALLEAVRAEWGPSGDAVPPMPSPAAMRDRLADRPWLGDPPPAPGGARLGRLVTATIAAIGVCTIGVVALRGDATPPPSGALPAATVAATVVATARPPREPALPAAPSFAVEALPDAPPVLRQGPARAAEQGQASSSPVAATRETDTLADEVALLHAAQGSLRDGAPDRALVSLAAHASRFPRGVLRDERMTLQALALCARGDVGAAKAVRAELERSSPGSSHLQRLASSCAR